MKILMLPSGIDYFDDQLSLVIQAQYKSACDGWSE